MTDTPIAVTTMTQLFLRLRQRGYKLGIDEYRAGLQALEAGYGANEETFLAMVEILWCSNRSQQIRIGNEWEEVKKSQPQPIEFPKFPSIEREPSEEQEKPEFSPPIDNRNKPEPPSEPLPPQPVAATLPVRSPSFSPIAAEELLSLQSYYPLSRRAAIYGWRFLRKMVADGSRTEIDLPATIQAVCDRGDYLAPLYRRQQRNAARLLLLIDQNGSMMPFHRFTRDVVETAQNDSPLASENLAVYYFHNVPSSHLYGDLYLTEPIPSTEVLGWCDRDTSVLIVSDAGAARGYRRQDRIQTTTRFLLRLRQRTDLIAWLNPMPSHRWEGSSAEILAYLVQMFQMDKEGFGNAIDALRGLTSLEVLDD